MGVKISFIVPVYNVSQYLEQCINSLLMQSIDKEIILVDDASTDESWEICNTFVELFPEMIKAYHQTENKGQSAARNIALKEATGQYIMFVDSDDFLRFDCLNILYKLAKENQLDFLRCTYVNCTADGEHYLERKIHILVQEGKILKGTDYLKSAIDSNTYEVVVWSALFRKDFIMQNSLWFPEGYYYEDHEWTLRMLFNCQRMMICALPIYAYRINPVGTVCSMSLDKLQQAVSLVSIMLDEIEKANASMQVKPYLYAAAAQLLYHATGMYGRISQESRKNAARILYNFPSWNKMLSAPTPTFIHRKLWMFRYTKFLVDFYYRFRKA